MFVRAYNLIILLNNKNQFTIPISQLFGSLVGHFSTYHKTGNYSIQGPINPHPSNNNNKERNQKHLSSHLRLKLIELKTKMHGIKHFYSSYSANNWINLKLPFLLYMIFSLGFLGFVVDWLATNNKREQQLQKLRVSAFICLPLPIHIIFQQFQLKPQ